MTRDSDNAEFFDVFVQEASEPFPAHAFEPVSAFPELCSVTRILGGEKRLREYCPYAADHCVHQVG
jgi:hypothetical protein